MSEEVLPQIEYDDRGPEGLWYRVGAEFWRRVPPENITWIRYVLEKFKQEIKKQNAEEEATT